MPASYSDKRSFCMGICDELERFTGISLTGAVESCFFISISPLVVEEVLDMLLTYLYDSTLYLIPLRYKVKQSIHYKA